MKRIRTNFLMVASAATGLVTIGSVALVNADAVTTTTSSTHISRYAHSETRLNAEAIVLGTTPTNLENTLKTTTLKQLLASKGLTAKQFHSQVKAEVTKELKADGYTTAQIEAMQMHHHKHDKKNS
jgi:hypothetical protein